MSIENIPNHAFNTSEFEELRQNSWDKWSSATCKCIAATRISNRNLSYPLRPKTCTIWIVMPHLTPILHWEAPPDEWQWSHRGMDQQTGRANQLKNAAGVGVAAKKQAKTFPSSETGCLSEPRWTELYNWAWGHSSTSCHLALTRRLPTGRTTLALGTVQGFFMCLI